MTQQPTRPAVVSFPGGVVQMPALTYGLTAGYRPVTFDRCLPAASMMSPPTGFSLVIYILGGARMVNIPQQSNAFVDFPGVLASLAVCGYIVASLACRLKGEARWPAQPTDVGTAVHLTTTSTPHGWCRAYRLAGISPGWRRWRPALRAWRNGQGRETAVITGPSS